MASNVVITGLGAVTPLGIGAGELFARMARGESVIGPCQTLTSEHFPCGLAAVVPESFSAKDFVPKHYRKATKVMARDIELAVAAAKEAAEHAGLVTRASLGEDADMSACTYPNGQMGCHIGAGLINAESDELASAFVTAKDASGTGLDLGAWGSVGMDNLTPLWMLKYLPNMLSCHVTILHGLEGPSNTITCSEASGLLSIAESTRIIERGGAKLCFSGSGEAKVSLMGSLRTHYAGRLATCKGSEDPRDVLRPFDPGSKGSVPGEAAGILILEDQQSAAARGAKVLAKVSGIGGGQSPRRAKGDMSAEQGLMTAMASALRDAGLGAGQIDAVVLLGTGMPTIDIPEVGAVHGVFGSVVAKLPMVAVAPSIGHPMAGASGVMAIVGVQMLVEQRLPADSYVIEKVGAVPVKIGAQARTMKHVLIGSTALGGQSAAIVLTKV